MIDHELFGREDLNATHWRVSAIAYSVKEMTWIHDELFGDENLMRLIRGLSAVAHSVKEMT